MRLAAPRTVALLTGARFKRHFLPTHIYGCISMSLVGMARCAVPVAERSVRRRNECSKSPILAHMFRPLERGRGHRSAMSLPFRSSCAQVYAGDDKSVRWCLLYPCVNADTCGAVHEADFSVAFPYRARPVALSHGEPSDVGEWRFRQGHSLALFE